MIPVANPIAEPAAFDVGCHQPGDAWLASHPAKTKGERFPSYWLPFQPDLADGFSNRCGWWAMRIEDGHVDHYLSKDNHRHLAYTWNNYRYIAGSVNSSKKNHDDAVLDPFEAGQGWFEVILPSMQLIRTAQIPTQLLARQILPSSN